MGNIGELTIKKSICLLLRPYGSVAQRRSAGKILPFTHHSSTVLVPGEGRVSFKEAIKIKT